MKFHRKNQTKLLLVIIAVVLISLFFAFDLRQYLTLTYLKQQQLSLESYISHHFLLASLVYVAIYVLSTALSLPGATILTLGAGALFGIFYGTFLVSFASTIGATLAFLAARFLLKEVVQTKFKDKLAAINQGIDQDGGFYLFTLRLVPLFPFFMINLLMGLTPISTLRFFLVSQIGMLPGTLVYINAGTQIALIDSLDGIFSPSLILSFALLGIFPIFAKKLIQLLQNKKKSSNS